MTSKSLPWNNTTEEEKQALPFLLKPAGKDYLWGGRRLQDEFAKELDCEPLAETWECSTHPDGTSIVASGEYSGELLSTVLRKHPEYLGEHAAEAGELPILVKLIDAKQDLSVQVHPDDAYAKLYENGQRGKTEMWYVMDAAKDASLVYGFYHDMDKEELRQSIADGSLEKHLQRIAVHTDDVFFIEAGKVHAIGAGALVAEIQESSNLTYRLYDYNRLDKHGRPRELHIEKALQVADLRSSTTLKQPLRVLRYKRGQASELLKSCRYFQVERLLINTERQREMASFAADSKSFRVLLCTNGCGVILAEDMVLPVFKGDCFFVPANSVKMKIHGKLTFLNIWC